MSISEHKSGILFLLLSLLALFFIFLNLGYGSVALQPQELFSALLGQGNNDLASSILWKIRVPRTLAEVLSGAGLAISGLLMQTYFRNPIAGPFVLGISSGASLGVAFLILGGTWIIPLLGIDPFSSWTLVLASWLGSGIVLFFILLVAKRINDAGTLLIIGLMVGSVANALLIFLEFSGAQEDIKRFLLWSFGSLGGVTMEEIRFFLPIILLGIVSSLLLVKPLNALLLGEEYAASLGVNTKQQRNLIFILTTLLAGTVTAFCGPIAFIGIMVPHFARLLFQTQNHRLLIPACILLGMNLMLICGFIAEWPFSESVFPINAITSLIGAPIVIWIVLGQKRIIN